MKQPLLYIIQNWIGIFRKQQQQQQQQLHTSHRYITEFVNNRSCFGIINNRRVSFCLHKLIDMKVQYIHRQTIRPKLISGCSGASIFLMSTAVTALNYCPLILSFLRPSTLCPQPKHITNPKSRICRVATITTFYASTHEPYLPPDYTIDDDNDKNNNSNDDDVIPTTRRSRPKMIKMPIEDRSKLANDNNKNNDDMDLIEVGDSDGYVPTSRIMKGKKRKEKKSEPITPEISNSVVPTKTISNSVVPTKESKPTKAISNSVVPSNNENKKASASWMDRNNQFINTVGVTDKNPTKPVITSSTNRASVRSNDAPNTLSSSRIPVSKKRQPKTDIDNEESNRTFREDFRGTRVFVQGLPESCRWQGLKDHFRIAGNVVFASVSSAIDPNTGQPKGHGIVQFETTAEARNAIRIMRDHPLDGNVLFVREDVQDENTIRQLRQGTNDETDDSDSDTDNDNDESQVSDTYERKKGPTPPTKWKCADPEMVAQKFDETTVQTIQQILKARNQARRRRNYEACDAMRDELKKQYNVHLDDRLTMWWIGTAPSNVVEQVKSSGRWMDDDNNEKQRQSFSSSEWRQIPTSKENDACIDPDLIFGLLQQRDIARREKDFATADALLEQARTAPSETHLTIRIHDESKTWRVWSDDVPPRKYMNINDQRFKNQLSIESPPSEQCIALCLEYAPDKVDEVRTLLLKFPGREYNILKKLKQRYLNQES